MHNKAYVVDGVAAIIGGRNIGDEYFDASENVNFRDLDILLIGPVVAEVTRVFDLYWNSGPSMPIEAFKHPDVPPVDIENVRKALAENASQVRATEYGAGALTEVAEARAKDIRPHEWAWGPAEFLADDPDKVTPDVDTKELHLAPLVREWLDGAQKRILLISPYFVPGDKGVAYLTEKRAKGIEVSVLTNSLASTDAPAAHAGYVRYRRDLIAMGVEMHEMRAEQPAGGSSSGGGSGDPSGLVNLNSATQAELEALPGIGPSLAGSIVTERERRGGFRSVNELRDVRGIGEKRFADLKDKVTI